tara:strand:+ start:460 stop:945 length:486 start_codon:yes stop_codon:yes gene_type:complete
MNKVTEIRNILLSVEDANKWLVNNARRIEVEGEQGEISLVYANKDLVNKVVKITRRNNIPLNKEVYKNPRRNTDLGQIFLPYTNKGISQEKYEFCFQEICVRPWGKNEDDDDIIIKAWDKLNVKLKKQKIGSPSHGTKIQHDVGWHNCGLDSAGKLVVFDW